jgi:hypothetical protein
MKMDSQKRKLLECIPSVIGGDPHAKDRGGRFFDTIRMCHGKRNCKPSGVQGVHSWFTKLYLNSGVLLQALTVKVTGQGFRFFAVQNISVTDRMTALKIAAADAKAKTDAVQRAIEKALLLLGHDILLIAER